MTLGRRQMLTALGLGTLAGLHVRSPLALAAEPAPLRIVFYVTPHGHVPKAWQMPLAGAPDAFAERPLTGLSVSELAPMLKNLHPFRDRLLVIEGLSHTSALFDIAEILRTGGDHNNHSVGVADLLTGTRAQQRSGSPCTGGARSIDQELALRTGAPGRFGSRVYGFDYVPNLTVAPFSFLGPGQATPVVSSPAQALADLLGYYRPPMGGPPQTREARLAAMRASVLDGVAREYTLLAPRLEAEAARKLMSHRELVQQLASSLGAGPSAQCDSSVDLSGHKIVQLMRLIRFAFACDLTRVVTLVAPVPEPTELGYPSSPTMHSYAHQSIEGATSCGTTFNPVAERAMLDLSSFYASHLATLLRELDSIVEGSGTLLDHTIVVWLSELATPTHEHQDAVTILAGGGNGFFKMGRHVRYPKPWVSPIARFPTIGPGHNRLFVSLLQAFGQPDRSFGLTEARSSDGSPIPLSGPLTELHRA
jgi:hypothetical protein